MLYLKNLKKILQMYYKMEGLTNGKNILLATYNGQQYLREQLDSILSQSYSNFRLLISDDLSVDSTREILAEYVEKDKRIIVFNQEKNLGVVKNFEFLLKKVESKYYMFSDQDDIWK